jgi:type IV pilus assembly protein PilW
MKKLSSISERATSRGFSLIEVMIALALSLIAMLVIIEIFSISEARKRVTSGAADAQQTGSINLYQVGRTARMGGSGITQGDKLWGCTLNANRGGTQLVPPTATYPAPFDTIPVATRIFPASVFTGQGFAGNGATAVRGSDVVVFFSGDGESGQVQYDLAAAPLAGSNPSMIVQGNSNGFRRRDLLLAVQADRGPADCWVAQVNGKATGTNAFQPYVPGSTSKMQTVIPLDNGTDGPYNIAGGLSFLPSGQATRIVNLGRTPNFMAYAVNDRNQLVQYDFLNLSGFATNDPLVIAENVVDFRALLGVSDPAGSAVTWVSTASGKWSPTSLQATPNNADLIVAVRIAMVVKTGSVSNEAGAPTSYVLFPELATPLRQEVNIDTSLQRFRHQVYDTVMPVRNMRFVPQTR